MTNNLFQKEISGSHFSCRYTKGDIIAWIGSLGQTHEILIDKEKNECFRIAIATIPSKCVGPACRPYGLETFIEEVLGLKCVGQARRDS